MNLEDFKKKVFKERPDVATEYINLLREEIKSLHKDIDAAKRKLNIAGGIIASREQTIFELNCLLAKVMQHAQTPDICKFCDNYSPKGRCCTSGSVCTPSVNSYIRLQNEHKFYKQVSTDRVSENHYILFPQLAILVKVNELDQAIAITLDGGDNDA